MYLVNVMMDSQVLVEIKKKKEYAKVCKSMCKCAQVSTFMHVYVKVNIEEEM